MFLFLFIRSRAVMGVDLNKAAGLSLGMRV
ncbi:predicted protein [Sclerotinia sclerotiorum 1980 UF-70]|uniref:Uncharacterized protein n=1 Tax=Sclerotinia sclerotiorum (strain ATCC 18683 / 1980 / Ss-1) TaxID=665079 RepID=A7EDU5_SCLS1|nr:predicted protein [Sclerotinia sclerotiorum 1980 UF-70]EDO01011.1 predicted protein [Sclerotinia sclerotiorum 1980 UF-70]